MTRDRLYGSDTPFGQWLRQQPDLDSHQEGLVISDSDWMFQKYRMNIVDNVGTRELQFLMMVEVKTRCGEPSSSQQETLFFYHQMLNRKTMLRRINRSPVMVWSFGVFVLSLEGEEPEASHRMRWGVFQSDGSLQYFCTNSIETIKEVLRFDRRPSEPQKELELRRHHSTQEITVTECMPLGFAIEKVVMRRS